MVILESKGLRQVPIDQIKRERERERALSKKCNILQKVTLTMETEERASESGSIIWIVVEATLTLISVTRHITKACFWTLFGWLLPRHHKNISSDIVLITGGSRGLGRSLAIEFAKFKPKEIILWGRNVDNLSATAGAVQLHNVACSYMVCDVSKPAQVSAKAREVKEKHGVVTILVNNAGVVFGTNIVDSSEENSRQTFDVNALGPIRTVRAFLPDMVNRNHGHIVSINSVLGWTSLPGMADYVASKHALTGFMESLTMELWFSGKQGVHTTTIHPFVLDTDMFAGYESRFPLLLPALDKTYTAEKTVEAVLTNQLSITLPRLLYCISLVISFVPTEAILPLMKFAGVSHSVDRFQQQQKAQKKQL